MKSLESQLKAIAERCNGDLEDIAKAAITRTGNLIVQGSPFDKGRFINNWMSAFNKADKATNRADNTSGTDSTFDLRETVKDLGIGIDFYFTNSLPYSKRLEYESWSAQAPNGMVRVSVLHWDKIVKEEVNKRK